jgi:uncharacterized protein YegP (UPF0339 family)
MRIQEHWNGLSVEERMTAVMILLFVAVMCFWVAARGWDAIRQYRNAKEIELVKGEDVQPLETLMPKFEIVTNADNTYRVQFMAYNGTNWVMCSPVFTNVEDAVYTITSTKLELEVKYSILRGLAEDLKKAANERK